MDDFINCVADEQKRKDSLALIKLMEKATGDKPKMWGASLIGFGNLRYKSDSGREVEWFKVGFSPRKANLSLYFMGIDTEVREALLEKLGKHKTGGGCVYVNRLADVDVKVLEQMIAEGVKNK